MTTADFLTIDFPAMLAATLAGLSCAILGNFLMLRRQTLIADAVSHAVLPGIVAGFLVAGALAPLPLMIGALAAAIIAALLIEIVRRAGRLEAGAAMGVVFTVMFAAGIVLMERAGASNAHLDADHALFGNLEATLWLGVAHWSEAASMEALSRLPRQITTLVVVTLSVALLVACFFKELRLATFDPGFAASLGLPVRTISFFLIAASAVAAVAAFEAVGSILVIAMFVCPAATARMLTDRLSHQIWISMAAAVVAGVGGYLAAAFGPQLWNSPDSLSAAGMIAVTAGMLQMTAMIGAPRHGVLTRLLERRSQRRNALDSLPQGRV